jgi:hypothetical protein
MPNNKRSQDEGATDLRETARRLIASIEETPDRVQKRRLAEQAFELLRQAAKLAEQDEETAPAGVSGRIVNPVKAGT